MNTAIKNIIINAFKQYDPELIGIFGSYSRNENTEHSDIDILVKFKTSISLLQLVNLERTLSDKIGIKVDIVTDGSIKNKRLRESIESDLQIIFE